MGGGTSKLCGHNRNFRAQNIKLLRAEWDKSRTEHSSLVIEFHRPVTPRLEITTTQHSSNSIHFFIKCYQIARLRISIDCQTHRGLRRSINLRAVQSCLHVTECNKMHGFDKWRKEKAPKSISSQRFLLCACLPQNEAIRLFTIDSRTATAYPLLSIHGSELHEQEGLCFSQWNPSCWY
jgi:hypothetical protein